MNRVSTYSDTDNLIETLNGEPDISLDELVSAVIALARQVEKQQGQIVKLDREAVKAEVRDIMD